ncbi:phospholipid/cholesterol/gamma-HCH transport system permease protein [Desulfuromusa kysingii]|uniref:Phospholipid/cholesterol/gamma-HCH transport system permease protein n=1 Tax=Desulfuromusa kysingii TaxID=37625 RepID=A0A1H3YT28_9BACT|nr:ABC transporter permease [Desulfuromusa kysingii]SEA14703.1 phospholipid/cholesterol/gamma-HCH transport system permease protein [Desulfuromusa kysingii]
MQFIMTANNPKNYQLTTDANLLTLHLSGDWLFQSGIPDIESFLQQLPESHPQKLTFNCDQMGRWDTGLMIFLVDLIQSSRKNNIEVDRESLPSGVQKLLQLSLAVPERRSERRARLGQPILAKIGNVTIEMHRSWTEMLTFIGDVFIAFINFLRGRAHFRASDLLFQIEAAGPSALFIVTLISVLVGMILAFVGAVQLRLFGAEIFIANLVGLGMAREMGAMMTAIVMAGRTGAAYAALLGTMQVNEEIDALKTIAVSPIEFLVLPRLIALVITMPLLCVYADFMGIMGGAIVSATMLDISFFQYFQQIQGFVGLSHFIIGIVKAIVFGILIASAGCFRGLQCGRSASAVGFSATSAVVTSIVLIIVADAIITVLCQVLGV